ncbi:MAG TPA: MarR family winged helix-turn-helix transcriptional regulator [Acidimicrobiales bacterium]|nr:MarR family winged helix-turn-helix transcriptional regulator [Acidimicrobiales bacterium]
MPTPKDTPRSPRATDPAAVEAVRSLARAARILERASGDLGLAHYRVLSAIAAGEDRASRVAERFELGRPTISASVDALRRAGLIERTEVAADQRAFALRLTPRGCEELDRVEAEMVRVLDELCRRLPSGGPDQDPVAVLATLGTALDTRAAAGRRPPAGRRSAATGPLTSSTSNPSSSSR